VEDGHVDEEHVTESHRRPWRPSRSQITIASIVGGVLALFALVVGVTFLSGPTVPAGTTVSGVPIGGMNRDDAVDTVRKEVAQPAAQSLEFDSNGETLIVKPRQAGVWVNASQTVEPLLRRTWNPLERFLGVGSPKEAEPFIVVETDKLAVQMDTLDRLVATEPADPRLSVSGTNVRYVPGVQGRTLDRAATQELITASITQPRIKQDIPVAIAEPIVTVANADAAYAFATAAVSGPVDVVIGSDVAQIPASAIGNALSFEAVGGDYVPQLDGATLYASIEKELSAAQEPRDARFRVNKNGKLRIVPSRAGTGVDDDELAERVLPVLSQDVSGGGKREVTIPEGERQPSFTTADARALGIKDKLSSFRQTFPAARYRSINIGQAAEYVNGTILMPGDIFSMNETIKQRTAENGYVEGIIIGPGGVFEEAMGGGVSAATTAVWTAAFFAGMERVDTRAHSVYISRYQPGLEATVAWGFFDMKFRNDGPHPVLITTKMSSTSMTVEFWGTRVYDAIEAEFGPRTNVREPQTIRRKAGPGCSSQQGIPGFSINVDRVFYKGGKEVKRETIRTAYRAAPNVVCRKKKEKEEQVERPQNDRPSNNGRPPGNNNGNNNGNDVPEVFENVPAEQVAVG
jgi:vancomycin resistance protein YoaR